MWEQVIIGPDAPALLATGALDVFGNRWVSASTESVGPTASRGSYVTLRDAKGALVWSRDEQLVEGESIGPVSQVGFSADGSVVYSVASSNVASSLTSVQTRARSAVNGDVLWSRVESAPDPTNSGSFGLVGGTLVLALQTQVNPVSVDTQVKGLDAATGQEL